MLVGFVLDNRDRELRHAQLNGLLAIFLSHG